MDTPVGYAFLQQQRIHHVITTMVCLGLTATLIASLMHGDVMGMVVITIAMGDVHKAAEEEKAADQGQSSLISVLRLYSAW